MAPRAEIPMLSRERKVHGCQKSKKLSVPCTREFAVRSGRGIWCLSTPIHEADVTRAVSQGPAALARSACEPVGLGLYFMSPFRLVCGCRCRSAWQRHPHWCMAKARCLMTRWHGRGIQHRCCKSRDLHARGCCNKSVACEPLDHHLRQIGTGLSLAMGVR